MDSETELKGVKGWLLFLVISLIFLGPAKLVWSSYSEISELIQADPELIADTELAFFVSIAIWGLVGIFVLMSMATGLVLIFMRRPRAVKIAIIMFWIMGPVFLVPFIVFLLATDPASILPSDYQDTFTSLASAIIWTAYLLKSQRVKNTYGFNGWNKPAFSDAEPNAQL